MATQTLSPVDRLVNDVEAADILGIKPQTLRIWRSTGRYNLPFTKVGHSVRYRVSALMRFIDDRTVSSTGEAEGL